MTSDKTSENIENEWRIPVLCSQQAKLMSLISARDS